MGKKVVVIGGVALGPKVACRIKRLDPTVDVVVVDKDEHISYGGCGIPYYVGGDVADLEGLQSTSAHVLRDSRFFANAKGVEMQIRTEAVRIDRDRRVVKVRRIADGEESDFGWIDIVNKLGIGAPHECELQQMLRLAFSIGAAVDKKTRAFWPRNGNRDGRPLDTLQATERKHCRYEERDRVARAERGLGLAI